MIFLVFLFGLICLGIECGATYYLFIHDYFWTALFIFLLCVQTTMSAVWRALLKAAKIPYKPLYEEVQDKL